MVVHMLKRQKSIMSLCNNITYKSTATMDWDEVTCKICLKYKPGQRKPGRKTTKYRKEREEREKKANLS